MDILRRSLVAVAAIGAAGTIAAAGAAPAIAATTSGARYQELFDSASWIGPGKSGQLDQCYLMLLSAAASDGSPAYVSGLLENNTSDSCTGWLQDSVNGGAWTDVSPQVTLPATNQGLFSYPWAKTANYYAGPGTSVRACVLTPASPSFPSVARCGTAVTLKDTSTAAPANDATSIFYAHNNQGASVSNGGSSLCYAFLSSSDTLDKTAASQASMTINGTTTCTAWLETSADNGQTWQQATPTYSLPLSNPSTDWAFSPAVADGTGELARACVQSRVTEACTAAW